MKYRRSIHEQSYVKGLVNAVKKGEAAASDPQFKEKDNPYKRWEHRQSWQDGFRYVRNLTKQE